MKKGMGRWENKRSFYCAIIQSQFRKIDRRFETIIIVRIFSIPLRNVRGGGEGKRPRREDARYCHFFYFETTANYYSGIIFQSSKICQLETRKLVVISVEEGRGRRVVEVQRVNVI